MQSVYDIGFKNFIVYMTRDCNLSCSYCLNKLHHKEANMEPDIDKLIPAIRKCMASSPKDNFSFIFFGGEPFLKWEQCKRIMNELPEISNFIIQTNGTIIPPDLDEYPQLLVSFSMDPNRDRHNRDRGCWDLIYNNAKQLIDSGRKRLSAAYTFAPSDAKSLYDDVIALYEMGFKNVRVTRIKETPGTEEQGVWIHQGFEKIGYYLLDHQDLIFDNIFKFPLSNREKLKEAYTHFTSNQNINYCRAGSGKVWIDIDGGVYPCSSLIFDNFLMGNIYDGSITKFGKTIDRLPLMRTECTSCKYANTCFACIYEAYQENGTVYRCGQDIFKRSLDKRRWMEDLYEKCIERGFLERIEQ
jgi:uncharacterized protein